MGDHLQFQYDRSMLDSVLEDRRLDAIMQDAGDQVAQRARALAPRRTGNSGLGAESIHAEVHRGEAPSAFRSGASYRPEDALPTAYISWDQQHYYMLFQEEGTEHQVARPFLRPALEASGF